MVEKHWRKKKKQCASGPATVVPRGVGFEHLFLENKRRINAGAVKPKEAPPSRKSRAQEREDNVNLYLDMVEKLGRLPTSQSTGEGLEAYLLGEKIRGYDRHNSLTSEQYTMLRKAGFFRPRDNGKPIAEDIMRDEWAPAGNGAHADKPAPYEKPERQIFHVANQQAKAKRLDELMANWGSVVLSGGDIPNSVYSELLKLRTWHFGLKKKLREKGGPQEIADLVERGKAHKQVFDLL